MQRHTATVGRIHFRWKIRPNRDVIKDKGRRMKEARGITHICVLGHRVQLKKQRALDDLAHLEEGIVDVSKLISPPSLTLVLCSGT